MIAGVINVEFEPIIPLSIRHADGKVFTQDAIVDTGFNGLAFKLVQTNDLILMTSGFLPVASAAQLFVGTEWRLKRLVLVKSATPSAQFAAVRLESLLGVLKNSQIWFIRKCSIAFLSSNFLQKTYITKILN
jgi:predicted aspartyl protease